MCILCYLVLWVYVYVTLVLCSTTCYSYLVLSIVLHATQLGTLGITGTQYSTYPEYSWVVSCVVLCYAVGVLCYELLVVLYATLCTTGYSITIAMLYVYTEVWDTTHWYHG